MYPSTAACQRLHLLLVDDCEERRDFYELALEREFAILTAAHGADALTLALSDHPDAIILDVTMPGMDGWETCTELKRNANTADIPVILLTGAEGGDLSQHAMAVGASALLRKPCPAECLRQTIHAVLNSTSGRERQ